MPINYYMFFVSGLIPLIFGFLYYHDKVFGSVFKTPNGFTNNDLTIGRIMIICTLVFILGVFASTAIAGMVIHQGGVFQMMVPQVTISGSQAQETFNALMMDYGDSHRSFRHGFVHGSYMAVFLLLPVIGINALFERRDWKYVLIHSVYWFFTLGLMGGILCETLLYAPPS